MDNVRNQPPETLEDQLRRMIVTNSNNGAGMRPPGGVTSSDRPIVRLPPVGASPYPQQRQDPTSTARTRQQDHHVISPPRHSNPGPSMPRPGNSQAQLPHRPNQRERRMQPQAMNGPQINLVQRPPPHNNRQPPQHRVQVDRSAFQRNGTPQNAFHRPPPQRQLFDPNAPQGPPQAAFNEQRRRQTEHLNHIVAQELPKNDMCKAERDEKLHFRASLQNIISQVCDANPQRLPKVSLECYGSFQSGFASAGSDMDLVTVLQDDGLTPTRFSLMEDDLPRQLEKRLLHLGYGARLLTKTRVPIMKICEKPDEVLLEKLRKERENWDGLPDKDKYPELSHEDEAAENNNSAEVTTKRPPPNPAPVHRSANSQIKADGATNTTAANGVGGAPDEHAHNEVPKQGGAPEMPPPAADGEKVELRQRRDPPKPWTRERKVGPLDFPKSGVGIQSDINFFDLLGLHNTQLLRCYAACDPRVRPLVLCVKAWAKARKINSSYFGTLSSYGYVMMVLHYLTNITQPAVLPNLQMPWRPNVQCTPQSATRTEVDGWVVDFWRNEDEIVKAEQAGQMSSNRESVGSLLAGFFNYYSTQGSGPRFHWMQDVISVRTPGGRLSKEEKGWTRAITEESEGKRVQHRFLFCIEDPFELTHNVARTVTHFGISAIRDEFRRARRILFDVGMARPSTDGELFAQLVELDEPAQLKQGLPVNGSGGSVDTHSNSKDAPYVGQLESHSTASHPGTIKKAQHPTSSNTPPKPSTNSHAQSLDLANDSAFPALSSAKVPRKYGANASDMKPPGNFIEISGHRAQVFLEELKTKKAEAHAELTATGAAEAVLEGMD